MKKKTGVKRVRPGWIVLIIKFLKIFAAKETTELHRCPQNESIF